MIYLLERRREQPIRGYAQCSEKHTWRSTWRWHDDVDDPGYGILGADRVCPVCARRWSVWGRTMRAVREEWARRKASAERDRHLNVNR